MSVASIPSPASVPAPTSVSPDMLEAIRSRADSGIVWWWILVKLTPAEANYIKLMGQSIAARWLKKNGLETK